MFDSVYLKIKCPYCGEKSMMEAQTKDLDCELEKWKRGDFVGDDGLVYLDCVTECRSKKCLRPKDFGNLGEFFNVRVFLNKGIVSGNYKVI